MTEDELLELGRQLRVDSIRAAAEAGSGHPTSSMSAADLLAVLVARHLRYDVAHPDDPGNDHLIFSKGHASPLLYAVFKAIGAVSDEELLTFRTFGSRLEGHPTPVLPWVDVATGSLGQGVPVGVGVALAGKQLDRVPSHVWVLCGDSEAAEGSVWEAFETAGYRNLDNLTVLLDVNRLGQNGPTMLGWDLDTYARRADAFGWDAVEIDGHDPAQIDKALTHARAAERPTVILARTRKGSGVRAVEDQDGWHGKPLDDPDAAIAELGGRRDLTVDVQAPPRVAPHTFTAGSASWPRYDRDTTVATRRAYGDALAALGTHDPRVVVLDGEVGNSTYTNLFAEEHAERFFEMYIAEQQMTAAAVGLHVRGWKPFAATFAAFWTRAYDFIRMAAVSQADLRLCGSHAGVSIGEDGPSQMGLEDLAAFRAVHGSTVLYPSDGNQTVQLVRLMADNPGITYLRTTRNTTPVLSSPDDAVAIGGSRTLRQSEHDIATIVAAGITVHEAIAAADRLAGAGRPVRVIDAYSVKPLDTGTIAAAVPATGGRLVVVEDHWAEGGLGDAVTTALAARDVPVRLRHLAVRAMPTSGKPDELRREAGIDADAIEAAVLDLARR
jgi:transketolase